MKEVATTFKILSPLLERKATYEEADDPCSAEERKSVQTNIPPFWGLLKVPGDASPVNMGLEEHIIRSPVLDTDLKVPLALHKGLAFSVMIPVARNIVPITKGDVLTLPRALGCEMQALGC